jgi:hypothetical protein
MGTVIGKKMLNSQTTQTSNKEFWAELMKHAHTSSPTNLVLSMSYLGNVNL